MQQSTLADFSKCTQSDKNKAKLKGTATLTLVAAWLVMHSTYAA